jgi:DNA polymerase-3 subunit delta'
MDISEIIAVTRKISEYKVEVSDFLEILAIWYRDVLLFKATRDLSLLVFKDEYNDIKRIANIYAYEGLEEIIEALEKARQRLSSNVNFELTLELLFMTIKENE